MKKIIIIILLIINLTTINTQTTCTDKTTCACGGGHCIVIAGENNNKEFPTVSVSVLTTSITFKGYDVQLKGTKEDITLLPELNDQFGDMDGNSPAIIFKNNIFTTPETIKYGEDDNISGFSQSWCDKYPPNVVNSAVLNFTANTFKTLGNTYFSVGDCKFMKLIMDKNIFEENQASPNSPVFLEPNHVIAGTFNFTNNKGHMVVKSKSPKVIVKNNIFENIDPAPYSLFLEPLQSLNEIPGNNFPNGEYEISHNQFKNGTIGIKSINLQKLFENIQSSPYHFSHVGSADTNYFKYNTFISPEGVSTKEIEIQHNIQSGDITNIIGSYFLTEENCKSDPNCKLCIGDQCLCDKEKCLVQSEKKITDSCPGDFCDNLGEYCIENSNIWKCDIGWKPFGGNSIRSNKYPIANRCDDETCKNICQNKDVCGQNQPNTLYCNNGIIQECGPKEWRNINIVESTLNIMVLDVTLYLQIQDYIIPLNNNLNTNVNIYAHNFFNDKLSIHFNNNFIVSYPDVNYSDLTGIQDDWCSYYKQDSAPTLKFTANTIINKNPVKSTDTQYGYVKFQISNCKNSDQKNIKYNLIMEENKCESQVGGWNNCQINLGWDGTEISSIKKFKFKDNVGNFLISSTADFNEIISNKFIANSINEKSQKFFVNKDIYTYFAPKFPIILTDNLKKLIMHNNHFDKYISKKVFHHVGLNTETFDVIFANKGLRRNLNSNQELNCVNIQNNFLNNPIVTPNFTLFKPNSIPYDTCLQAQETGQISKNRNCERYAHDIVSHYCGETTEQNGYFWEDDNGDHWFHPHNITILNNHNVTQTDTPQQQIITNTVEKEETCDTYCILFWIAAALLLISGLKIMNDYAKRKSVIYTPVL